MVERLSAPNEVHAGPNAPEDTSKLWIDTDELPSSITGPANITATIKYYNSASSTWEYASGGAQPKVSSVNSKTGDVILSKSDIGLSNVDNTSNASERAAAATLSNKNITDASNIVPFRRVVFGTNNTLARPNATHVEWVGSFPPANADYINDTWIDTA